MFLNVVTLVLVLAITFMHSVFGFFSGLINVFCSIVSVAVALGFYEALNGFITGSFGLHPAYTEPACLIGLFIISMIVLRTLADNYIRGNVRVPAALDWGGASVCGLINAQLFVGILVLGVMMLPLRDSESGAVIGFARFERNPDERDVDHPEFARFDRQSLWTRPDEFTVGLFKLISGGSMRGKTAFASVYPDFAEAVFYSTNTVQPESTPSAFRDKKFGDGFAKGLQVEQWWLETEPIEARYRKERPSSSDPAPDYERVTFKPAAGRKLIGTRLALNRAAADRQRTITTHLFRPTMIRMVGKLGESSRQYAPKVIANADDRIRGAHRVVDYDTNFSIRASGNVRIYAYFEVDEGFTPEFVEYRRHARGAMSGQLEAPPDLQITLAGEDEEDEEGGRRGGGRRTFGNVLEARSGDNARLPFAMERRAVQGSGDDVRLEGDKFVSGRIFNSRDRLEHSSGEDKVEDIKLPAGKRLIQVRYKPKRARTIVGQVFNFVGQVNQYVAVDTNGEEWPLSGYYAMVQRGGDEYIELFFTGGLDTTLGASYRNMLDFKHLERGEINDQDDSVISLFFLVPPNTEIKRIENQAGDGGDVRLRARRN